MDTKKLLVASNICLIIAVAVLFYLHFNQTPEAVDAKKSTGEKTDQEESSEEGAEEGKGKGELNKIENTKAADFPIAYVNFDTLSVYYKYLDKIEADLERKKRQKTAQLEKEFNQFQEDYQEFAKAVQNGSIPRDKAEEQAAVYQRKQQKLQQKQQQMSQELGQTEMKLMQKAQNQIREYLRKYNEDLKYSYILSYGAASPVLFAHDSLDITQEVLKGLNEQEK